MEEGPYWAMAEELYQSTAVSTELPSKPLTGTGGKESRLIQEETRGQTSLFLIYCLKCTMFAT
jgi:hypothetical protein